MVMGISVVSGISPLSAAGDAGAPQAAGDAPLDFAALITQLTAIQIPPSPLQAALGAASAAPADEDEQPLLTDGTAALTPSDLLPLLMNSAPPPAPAAIDADALPGAGGSHASSGDPLAAAFSSRMDEQPGRLAGLAANNRELPAETATIAGEGQSGAGSQDFASLLATHGAAGNAKAAPPDNAAAVATPLKEAGWSQDFGSKVVWLAKNEQQTAQLSINPPQLGPVHVTINLNGDQAAAVFASPHAEVRQAIEDALPQLREMLSGAGINLGQANVGSQMPQQNNPDPQQFANAPRFGDDNAILRSDGGHGTSPLATATRGGRGMVDLFA